MAELEHRDLLERVWIAVISDHGEELGEKGLFNHRFTMSDEALHTVLMIRPPGGVRAPARFDGLVSLFDLSATLLEVASATPPTGSHGRSLLPVLEGRAFDGAPHVVSEGAFRLTSLRTPTTRLTFAGVSPESRFFDPLLGRRGSCPC
jgi:arylsulfatase A-like enzyme